MRPDPPSEGRSDACVLEIELSITDLSVRIIHGGLRASLVGGALINVLYRSGVSARQGLSAGELALCEREARACGLELRVRLSEPDLVGPRIDGEEQIAFADDIAVLEMYFHERAAHLCSQFDLLLGGKLAEEAQSRINLVHQRLAHYHLRKRSGSSRRGGFAPAIGIRKPCGREGGDGEDCNCASKQHNQDLQSTTSERHRLAAFE